MMMSASSYNVHASPSQSSASVSSPPPLSPLSLKMIKKRPSNRPRPIEELFPTKLYNMLEAESSSSVHGDGDTTVSSGAVSWLPHGRAFAIHNKHVFIAEVMPQFFQATKIRSFHRQLHLYGFHRITSGCDNGAWWHESFAQGSPQNLKHILLTRVKSSKQKASEVASESATSMTTQSTMCMRHVEENNNVVPDFHELQHELQQQQQQQQQHDHNMFMIPITTSPLPSTIEDATNSSGDIISLKNKEGVMSATNPLFEVPGRYFNTNANDNRAQDHMSPLSIFERSDTPGAEAFGNLLDKELGVVVFHKNNNHPRAGNSVPLISPAVIQEKTNEEYPSSGDVLSTSLPVSNSNTFMTTYWRDYMLKKKVTDWNYEATPAITSSLCTPSANSSTRRASASASEIWSSKIDQHQKMMVCAPTPVVAVISNNGSSFISAFSSSSHQSQVFGRDHTSSPVDATLDEFSMFIDKMIHLP